MNYNIFDISDGINPPPPGTSAIDDATDQLKKENNEYVCIGKKTKHRRSSFQSPIGTSLQPIISVCSDHIIVKVFVVLVSCSQHLVKVRERSFYYYCLKSQ